MGGRGMRQEFVGAGRGVRGLGNDSDADNISRHADGHRPAAAAPSDRPTTAAFPAVAVRGKERAAAAALQRRAGHWCSAGRWWHARRRVAAATAAVATAAAVNCRLCQSESP